MPAWFTLQAYGKDGYQSIVENNVALAKQLGKAIENSAGFMLALPVRPNTVCFTVTDTINRDNKIKLITAALNDSGKVFMTSTIYKGISC